MKNIKLWSTLLLVLYSRSLFTQDFCSTYSNIPDFLQTIPQSQLRATSANTNYVIRIFFHIIRQSNGIGGQTQSEVNTAFNTLQLDYRSYGISFELLGTDEILNDNYYNGNINFNCNTNGNTDCDGDGKFDNFHPNLHTNAIDIYLFANNKLNSGLAAGIPSCALVIGGNAYNTNLASSHVLSHEIGHCLGLYHTFHGLCEGGCAELVNGSNCSTCGDFVCDTPADPQMHQVNQNTCVWNGSTCSGSNKDTNGDSYHPSTNLFMAYIAPNCMQQHTQGQVERMKAVIANSSVLQNVIAPPTIPSPTISGPTLLCRNSDYFTVSDPPAGFTWGISSNLNIISASSNTVLVEPSDLDYTSGSSGWVSINLNGKELAKKEVWIGYPSVAIDGPDYVGSSAGRFRAVYNPLSNPRFYWSVQTDGSYKYSVYSYGDYADIYFYNYATYTVVLNACNDCGCESDSKPVQAYVYSSSPLTAYPNPVSDILNIEIDRQAIDNARVQLQTDSKIQCSSDPIFEFRLYNELGVQVRYATAKNGIVELNVSNLPNGLYYLHIYDGVNSIPEKQTIRVKH